MSILLLSVVGIVGLSILGAILFALLFFALLGEILLAVSLKRCAFAGKKVEKEMIDNKDFYKIDYEYFDNFNLEELTIITYDSKKLYPVLIKQKQRTNKVAIIIHGYYANFKDMSAYAKLFYELGYNLVLTQNRAHGKSEGKYIGMGWLDRLDVLQTIHEVIARFGKNCEIDLFGLSMGGATVCMLSGEDLPSNVKHIISDCAYACPYEVFKTVYETRVNFLSKPILNYLNYYAKLKCGYSLKNADARTKICNAKVPILLIHGEEDKFVPYENLQILYESAPKNLRYKKTFKGARHAESLPLNEEEYKNLVKNFLADNFDKLNLD